MNRPAALGAFLVSSSSTMVPQFVTMVAVGSVVLAGVSVFDPAGAAHAPLPPLAGVDVADDAWLSGVAAVLGVVAPELCELSFLLLPPHAASASASPNVTTTTSEY